MGDNAAIVLDGLSKSFRGMHHTMAVSGVDLEVPRGSVFGFVGLNGAGKTTTIRCILGLARPTAGRAFVLGAATPYDLHRVIARVGASVDAPNFYPAFTGRLNLQLLASMSTRGSVVIDRVLEIVELSDRADDRFASYSRGMKQRLGLAAALLKDPELLILDEPSSGLDPAGIRAMHDVIRRRGEAGLTVFVSSHLLTEVQSLCDRVAIIHRGSLVYSGTIDHLLSLREQRVTITIEQLDEAFTILVQAGYITERDSLGTGLLVDTDPDRAGDIVRILGAKDLYPSRVAAEHVSLEDVFLELTNEDSLGETRGDLH